MTDIKENLKKVRHRVASTALAAGREMDEIRVMAVTKRHSVAAIRTALAAGQTDFGENFLQEALPKIKNIGSGPCWHFIGRIQSNKTRAIAEHFHWAHTVDRLRIAERLNHQRPAHLPPLNLCIQINIAEDDAKGGIPPRQLVCLINQISGLSKIRLRGLMCIPPASDQQEVQRQHFRDLRNLYQSISTAGPHWDTLSMGMSGDLESAVFEGATIVRIGTAIFGPRS